MTAEPPPSRTCEPPVLGAECAARAGRRAQTATGARDAPIILHRGQAPAAGPGNEARCGGPEACNAGGPVVVVIVRMPGTITHHLHLLAGLSWLGLLGLAAPAMADDPSRLVSSGSAFITADDDGRSWTIGNEVVRLRVGQSAAGYAVLGLERAALDGDVMPAALPDASLVVGARRLVPGAGSLVLRDSQVAEAAGAVRLKLVFEDAANHIRLTRVYACYPAAPGIETWSIIETLGASGTVVLSDIGVWQFTVPANEVNWVTGLQATSLDGGRFTRRRQVLAPAGRFEIGSTGRSSETALPVAWLKGPAGHLFFGLMWSGAWDLTVTGPDAGGLATVRLSLGAVATGIRTGKPLESPHAFFGVAGEEPSDVTAAIQAFARHDVRQGRPLNPLVTYNTWFAYGIGITEGALKAEMNQAAALGTEVFVVDAGWYTGGTRSSDFAVGLGTWRADVRRFPSGLGALSDYAHGLGMKFGIWIEPERTDTGAINGAGLVRETWLATTGGRYNAGVKNSSAGAAQICLASAEARQWVSDQLERLIAEARLDYLKWDNNYWINCDRTGHGHDSKDGGLAHVKGLYDILAALRERHPDLVVENCAEGGHRLDFGMLRLTDTAWMDDESSPSPHVRHNLQGLSAVFPAEYLLSFAMDHPTEPIHGAADMAYTFRSRMTGTLGMSLLGAEFDEHDRAQMQEEVALSKHVRSLLPQPVTLLLTDQAFAAGGTAWDAVELVSPESGNAVLFTYAAEGADDWATIRLQALEPDRRYTVRTIQGRALAESTGADLMADGIQVPKRRASAANVLVIEAVGLPSPLRH